MSAFLQQWLRVALCACVLLGTGALLAQESGADLSGNWRVAFRDQPDFAKTDYDDGSWASIRLPGNLARQGAQAGRWLWLRKRVQMSGPPDQNLAITLGAVYDEDEVYVNGVSIGATAAAQTRPKNYGRPRVYPIPSGLLINGDNTIAIRLRGSFKNEIGIMAQGPRLLPLPAAHARVFGPEVKGLIYAAIYLVIGIFFIMLYFRIEELREYLWFGIFATVFGLMQFTRNEYRFALGDWFLLFKFVEQITYTVLPTVYLFFFRSLFRLQLPKAIYIYPLINLLTAATLVVLFNPLWWDRIIGYWFFLNIPFFGYYTYGTLRRAVDRKEIEALIIGAATVTMVLATIHFFAVERGFLDGPSYFSFFSLVFMLAIALALIYRMITLQQEVEERQNRLGEVNDLRDRVFSYINTFVRKPAEELARLSTELFSDEQGEMSRMALAAETEQEVDNLQTDLDDILELSRLEVIQEPEYVETVNFNDFITAVIPEGDITCYIKVNPDIVLKTSLELVNSIVIRLIDFPGFRQFKHIDLIITSDLRQNIHFRFLLYHTNFRETRKLYELLTSENPERGSLWVKWGIIRQIIRILDGQLDISIVNRKFLRIDIRLSAELPPEASRTTSRSGIVEVRPAGEPLETVVASPGGDDEDLAVAAAAGAAARAPARPLPKFSKDMSVGDFVQAVGARIKRR